jgi:hypothetical protein
MKKLIFSLIIPLLLATGLHAQTFAPVRHTNENLVLTDNATWDLAYFNIPRGPVPGFPSYVRDADKCGAFYNKTTSGHQDTLKQYDCSTNTWKTVAPNVQLKTINSASLLGTGNIALQPQLSGTGFVKVSGTSISYDNSIDDTISALKTALGLLAPKKSPTFTGMAVFDSVSVHTDLEIENILTVGGISDFFDTMQLHDGKSIRFANSTTAGFDYYIHNGNETTSPSSLVLSAAFGGIKIIGNNIYDLNGKKFLKDTLSGGGGASGANPTASIGVTTVNGTATSFMRSDAAPKVDTSLIRTAANSPTLAQLQTRFNLKQNTLTFDSTPTSSSTNPVTSGGVFTALAGKQGSLTFDSTPTSSSTNPVTSGGVFTALALKAPLASPTFTGTPTLPGFTLSGDILPNSNNLYNIGASGNVLSNIWSVNVTATNVETQNLGIGGPGGSVIQQVGTIDGDVQMYTQAHAGSWPWYWPVSAGSAGTMLTSGGGGSPTAAMTWTDMHNYAFLSPTATTQSALDNSTKVATTAYADAAVNATATYFSGFSGSGTALDPYTVSGGSVDQTAAYTWTGKHIFNNSVTASSALAEGTIFSPTLTAAANNDVLAAIHIMPTYTLGGHTGTHNLAVLATGSAALGKVFGFEVDDNVNTSSTVLFGSLMDPGGSFSEPGIWMSSTYTSAPSASNYIFNLDNGNAGTVLNGPATVNPISFRINNVTKAQITTGGIFNIGILGINPAAFAAVNSTATLTTAQMVTGYITCTSASAETLTTATATALGTALDAGRGYTYRLFIDNSAGANTVTLSLGTGFTFQSAVTGGTSATVSATQDIAEFDFTFTSATTGIVSRMR